MPHSAIATTRFGHWLIVPAALVIFVCLTDTYAGVAAVWETSPIVITHTHLDPDNIPRSIDELIRAGVTTAILDLTIDDGDYRSDYGSDANPYETILQKDTCWGVRFQKRLAVLEKLAASGKVILIKKYADIPVSRADIQRLHHDHRISIVIASEGSNQLEGPQQLSAADVLKRDADSKTPTLHSIQEFRARGWLSTAPIHLNGQVGHRLLRPDGNGLNDYGRFVILALQNAGILVDLPHVPAAFRNEVLDIAELTGKPVMISHDTIARLLRKEDGGPDVLYRIARSGHGTGLIGIHTYESYLGPNPTVNDLAMVIDDGKKFFDGLSPSGHGDEHIALGIDWFWYKDMDTGKWAGRSPGDALSGIVPILSGPCYNYSDDQIRNILGLNVLRMLKVAWDH